MLLQGEDGGGLEAEVSLEVLGDLADEALEGQLADQQVGALLELADLTQGDGAGAEAMRLLDATGVSGGLGLLGGLGGDGLARSLASSGLTGGLLGTSHLWIGMREFASGCFSDRKSIRLNSSH